MHCHRGCSRRHPRRQSCRSARPGITHHRKRCGTPTGWRGLDRRLLRRNFSAFLHGRRRLFAPRPSNKIVQGFMETGRISASPKSQIPVCSEERKMIRVKNLSVLLALALSITAIAMTARAQDKDAKPADKPADAAPAAPPKEESSVTEHSIKIGGQNVPYRATAATILLKNEKDEPTALVYYTAYTRSDLKDLSQRPSRSFITAVQALPRSGCIWARFRRDA